MQESIRKIEVLLEKISKINSLDKDRTLFNSDEPYISNQPISLNQIREIETLYEIELPEDYKVFLSLVGNGYFGVLPLTKSSDGDDYSKNDLNNLKNEFPLNEEWNYMKFDEFVERYNTSNRFVLDILNLDDFRNKYFRSTKREIKFQQTIFGERKIIEDDYFLSTLYDQIYFSDKYVYGSLHLMDYGCGTNAMLVVSGKQKGKIWIDDRANRNGIYPELDDKGQGAEFYLWMDSWLDELLLRLKKKVLNSNF